jgi:hypothetical protein
MLRERDPGIGRTRLSRLTNLSEKQVRAILSSAKT